jgi:hypothetical protein
MSQRLRIGNIVHRHDVDIFAVQTGANHIPANAAEAINANFNCHFFSCLDEVSG